MAGKIIVMAMNANNWMLLRNKIHCDESQRRLPLNLSYSIHQNRKSVRIWRKFRVRQQKEKKTAAETNEYEETVVDYNKASSSGIKLTANVAVRTGKAFANNFLSIFMPPNHSESGIVLQLVGTKLDLGSMKPKLSKETVLDLSKDHKFGDEGRMSTHKVQFLVDPDFGVPGAVTVVNCCDREFFLESINIVQGSSTIHYTCNSWVQSNKLDADKRNPKAESRPSESESIYVPRDEEYGDIKLENIDQGKLMGMLRNVVPALMDNIMGSEVISNIDYYIREPKHSEPKSQLSHDAILASLPTLSQVLLNLRGAIEEFLKFDPPKTFSKEKSHFLLDDEFGRQVLAGLNPLSIERLKVFPPVSKLDSSIYGAVESALKEEDIIGQIEGMSIQQALEENKLYILDYHDIYLPFLERINALDERKAYATTTIFFLTKLGTLKPIAIQLALPTKDPNTVSKQVLTPPIDDTSKWLWQLGKAHVCANDAGDHTLVHHWLRIHGCMEPLIIAAHRQLSVMHPVFKLLHPHMRYTLKTNAIAREVLINAEGSIETNYTPGKYCMQITCAAYKDWWRFDMEGLPADLIRRGLAVPNATQPHGIRLLIEDYPYAADGLLIWSSTQKLIKTYVNHYYKGSSDISSDNELQSWYKEFINLGHPDHKNASWWPKLNTPEDLISLLTTIIWFVSAQHAVLNFSQYPYAGYVPKRPPLMRKLIPNEDDSDYTDFVNDPKGYFLSSLPSLFQATKFMAVINIGSAHSPDEEYIGDRNDLSSWLGEPEIVDAFNHFSMEMKNIEIEIERRNVDPKLRNRSGFGVSPYELLIPSSRSGATGRGVPNSATA